jgi:phosphopantothenoylcysteine decarboxylase/phosphopantothenate--cysteine ligase
VANDITAAGAGFAVDTNRVSIVFRDGEVENWDLAPKVDIARQLWDLISREMGHPR